MTVTTATKSIEIRNPLAAGIILLACFLLYGNTIWHEYTQDDAIVIYDNMYTSQGIKGIPGLLKHDTFYGFFKEKNKDKLVSGGRYRPLTPVMFAIEVELFDDQKKWGHIFNILWYSLLGFVLFVLMVKITDKLKIPNHKLLAIAITLLYLAHPVHTEVVANIKGRDEIMSMLGCLTSLAILMSDRLSKAVSFITIMVCALLAALSKENTVTFLAIIPLALYFFKGYNPLKALSSTLPFFIGVAIFIGIRTYILGLDLGGTPMELMNNPFLKIEDGAYVSFSFSERMATIFYTLLQYIRLLIFPLTLTHDYYPRHIDMMTFGDLEVLLSLALYLSMLVVALWSLKKYKIIAFAILFYLATLSIVSNIVFPIGTNMSERFLFMPSLGFCILLGYSIFVISRKSKPLFVSIIAVIFILYSIKTIDRNRVWKDDYTLFTTDVKTSKNSAKVLNAAGGTMTDRAAKMEDGSEKKALLDQAIIYLNKASQIHPNYAGPYMIKGNAHYFNNQLEEAIGSYNKALQVNPGMKDAAKNLAIALRDAGRLAGEKERNLEKSIKYLTQSIQLSDTDPETHRLLGVAYGIAGQHQKAVEYFHNVVRLNPENASAALNLSNAYLYLQDTDNARLYKEKALQLDPSILNK